MVDLAKEAEKEKKKKKKKGRPKGSLGVNTIRLMEELRKNKFELVPEIVKLYREQRKIIKPLYKKLETAIKKGEPVDNYITKREFLILESMWGRQYRILQKLIGYLYPKLGAVSIDNNAGERVVFNIELPEGVDIKHIGGQPVKQLSSPRPPTENVIDVTPIEEAIKLKQPE